MWCNGYANGDDDDLRWVIETVFVVESPDDAAASLTAGLQKILDAMRVGITGEDHEEDHSIGDNYLIASLKLISAHLDSDDAEIVKAMLYLWKKNAENWWWA